MDSKKMNIAVVFEGELQGGGGYQQQLSTITELNKLDRYNFIAFVFSQDNKKNLESYSINSVVVKTAFFDRIYRLFHKQSWFLPFSRQFKLKTLFEKSLDVNGIDLVYFLSPSRLSLDLTTHNYIITVWDLCHRDTPEFPEVNYFREFELREQLYTKSLKKAVAVLVDSELGKINVIKRYGIDDSRAYVAQFAPSIYAFMDNRVDVKTKYQIIGEYIYYPAQLWSHKNHVYIIDAVAILKQQGINLTAIFSGANKGNLNYVLDCAKKLNVSELVKYIGFAPNEEVYSLYKNALAMVMPSYFGPTNIPPLEAFAIGTPVIYSDLDGLRDQVGDAALLCDLKNPNDLAEHLKNLLESENLRNYLISKGENRLNELSQRNVVDILSEIFDDYAIKLKCWNH
ncbi:MAG: glycosyltransferase family 4 protein [Sulfurimonas sp.]|nr:glycosyltransferase family 4 protein [Sulfurimonas sp.]